MTNNNNDNVIAINLNDAIAHSTPMPTLDGSSPINADDARAYYQQKVNFHLNRISRAAKRPTPQFYNEKGELSVDMQRFQNDMSALLHAQKCRAAIETVMTSSKTVNFLSLNTGHVASFNKISEDTLLITDC